MQRTTALSLYQGFINLYIKRSVKIYTYIYIDKTSTTIIRGNMIIVKAVVVEKTAVLTALLITPAVVTVAILITVV